MSAGVVIHGLSALVCLGAASCLQTAIGEEATHEPHRETLSPGPTASIRPKQTASIAAGLYEARPYETSKYDIPELGDPLPPQDSGRDLPVVVEVALSHAAFSSSSPEVLFLKLETAATPVATTTSRPPLNLVLLIDASGSMAKENKFERAMQAARLVVENLSERDSVAVVAFSKESLVLSPLGPAVNRIFLDHRLNEIAPDGWTNLSAGLLESFAQLDSKASDAAINRVVLLTDGEANRGVLDPDQLAQMVAKAHERGIGVSTIGCGGDFDASLLTALAEAGGGRYTYINESEQIPQAMAAELDGLLSVVAQNVTVEVETSKALAITRVYGRLLERPTHQLSFNLGDVREGERSIRMLELTPTGSDAGSEAALRCSLSMDRTDLSSRETREVLLPVAAISDKGMAVQGTAPGIGLFAAVLDATERAEDALLGLDSRGFQDASESFEKYHEKARLYALENRDQQLLNQAFLLKHLLEELAVTNEWGLMHEHEEARGVLDKEVGYRRYLRQHHRAPKK